MAHILVIESDQAFRDSLGGVLTAAGNEVTAVGSSREGLEAAVGVSPDLIVTAMQLPGADGVLLLQQLRELDAAASIPIIALTEIGTPKERDQARAFGVVDYLLKPLSPDEIALRVKLSLGASITLGKTRPAPSPRANGSAGTAPASGRRAAMPTAQTSRPRPSTPVAKRRRRVPATPPPPPRPMETVVAVETDDSEFVRMDSALRRAGYDVVRVNAPSMAKLEVMKLHPAIVIIGSGVAGAVGDRLLRELSPFIESDGTQIIPIESPKARGSYANSFSLGARQAVLGDPIDVDLLQRAVERAADARTSKLRRAGAA